MNKRTLAELAIGSALVAGTNLYWRRREQAVRDGLTTSRKRQESGGFQREEVRAAEEAADALNTRPADLPEKVEALDEKVRKLNHDLDSLRKRWVDTWWSARMQQPIDPSEPHVLSITLEEGTLSDAEAFGERTAMDEWGIAIITAHADSTFVITVGEELSDEFGAADLAQELSDRAGGGAGGDDHYATGGDVEELQAGSQYVRDQLEEKIE